MSEQTVRTPESVQKEIRNRRHKAELPLFVINSIIGPVFLCIAGIVLFGEYGIVDLIKEGLENAEITETSPEFSALTAGIIVISVGITLIGMASNQLIGFEGRKKECAVMLSTAMGKGTLSGILFREMLISSLTASALGTAVGVLMVFILDNATSASEEMKMAIEIDPIMTIAFFVFLVAAFVATVLFPIKNLRKMKIAEQIKYE